MTLAQTKGEVGSALSGFGDFLVANSHSRRGPSARTLAIRRQKAISRKCREAGLFWYSGDYCVSREKYIKLKNDAAAKKTEEDKKKAIAAEKRKAALHEIELARARAAGQEV